MIITPRKFIRLYPSELKSEEQQESVEGPPEDPWPIPLSFTAESEGPSGPEHASQFPKRCFVNKI